MEGVHKNTGEELSGQRGDSIQISLKKAMLENCN
jgi:hypothetical protein